MPSVLWGEQTTVDIAEAALENALVLIPLGCTEQHAADGRIGIRHLHQTRPGLAEEISVKETLAMAEYTGAPVYFVHQSTPGAVERFARCGADGNRSHGGIWRAAGAATFEFPGPVR